MRSYYHKFGELAPNFFKNLKKADRLEKQTTFQKLKNLESDVTVVMKLLWATFSPA